MDTPGGDPLEITDEVLQYASLIASRKKYWTNDLDDLFRRWQKQLFTRQIGHTKAERRYNKIYYILGIPTTILTSVVSTGILATFRNCDTCSSNASNSTTTDSSLCANDEWIRLFIGLVGLIATVLTACMTYLDAGGQREKHKNAVDSYSGLSRQIDATLRTSSILRGDPLATINEVQTKFDGIVKDSPSISSEYKVELLDILRSGGDSSTGEKVVLPMMETSPRFSFDRGLVNALDFELKRLNSSGAVTK